MLKIRVVVNAKPLVNQLARPLAQSAIRNANRLAKNNREAVSMEIAFFHGKLKINRRNNDTSISIKWFKHSP